ncbi:hypothetical protein GO491_05195 [Flavobacteriaceae bacterium Ap0902]|nr:hypothetical protein [Flavobacteriaceae bacterium Ap0902]
MKRILYLRLAFLCSILLGTVQGQETSKISTEVVGQEEIKIISRNQENEEVTSNSLLNSIQTYKPHGKFGFFLIGGYSFGLNDHTSATGKYIENDEEASNNFYLKYARVNGAFQITPKIKANLLLNLADFQREDLSRRVLEIASVTYAHDKAFNVKVGQFRPYFGIEDTYGIANHKSYTWSNAYSVMGNSQWQSFQMGVSIYGDLNENNIPIKYYLNAYNGNGKNRITDNDSNKNLSSRLVLTAIPGVEIGANYAFAKHLEEDVNAAAFDFKTSHGLSSQLALNTEFSYAFGHNIGDAIRQGITNEFIDDYKFRGWYFIPELVLAMNSPHIQSLELSCRYESLYTNLEEDKNKRTTITPMIGMNIGNNFKTSLVVIIDQYDKEQPTNGLMDTTWMQLQLQFNY